MKVKSLTEIGQIDVDQDGIAEVLYKVQTSQGYDVLLKKNVEGTDYYVRLSPGDQDKFTNLMVDSAAGTVSYTYEDKRRSGGGKGGGGLHTYHGKRFLDRDDMLRIANCQIKFGGVKVELPTV